MFERFTDRSRKVMVLANQEAQRLRHAYLGTEHILLGMLNEGSGVGATVLKNLSIDLPAVRSQVEKLLKPGPDPVTNTHLPQTPRAKNVITFAIQEARYLGHNYVGTEHLLLGLLRENEGLAAQVLINLGLNLPQARAEVLRLLGTAVATRGPHDQPPRPIDPRPGFEGLSDRARTVMALANQEAQRFNHTHLGTEHILLALVKEGSNTAAAVLKNLDLDLRNLRLEVEKRLPSGPDMVAEPRLPHKPEIQKVIEYATEDAAKLGHNYIGPEHLLLGMLRLPEGAAAQIFADLRLKPADIRAEILNLADAGWTEGWGDSRFKIGLKEPRTPAAGFWNAYTIIITVIAWFSIVLNLYQCSQQARQTDTHATSQPATPEHILPP